MDKKSLPNLGALDNYNLPDGITNFKIEDCQCQSQKAH